MMRKSILIEKVQYLERKYNHFVPTLAVFLLQAFLKTKNISRLRNSAQIPLRDFLSFVRQKYPQYEVASLYWQADMLGHYRETRKLLDEFAQTKNTFKLKVNSHRFVSNCLQMVATEATSTCNPYYSFLTSQALTRCLQLQKAFIEETGSLLNVLPIELLRLIYAEVFPHFGDTTVNENSPYFLSKPQNVVQIPLEEALAWKVSNIKKFPKIGFFDRLNTKIKNISNQITEFSIAVNDVCRFKHS